jgi:L-asparaginase
MKLLVTGGTIDKKYNPLSGQLELNESHIATALTQGRCHLDIELETIFLKDSLDITEAERAQIIEKCIKTKHEQIVITHGTDTMVTTAELIAAQFLDKTIVLTGATLPFNIKNSDALFNLGAAITAAQCLAHGVYIAMNGRIFNHDNVIKNLELGVFEVKA